MSVQGHEHAGRHDIGCPDGRAWWRRADSRAVPGPESTPLLTVVAAPSRATSRKASQVLRVFDVEE